MTKKRAVMATPRVSLSPVDDSSPVDSSSPVGNSSPAWSRVFALRDALPSHPPVLDIVLAPVVFAFPLALSDALIEDLAGKGTDEQKVATVEEGLDELVLAGGRHRKFALLLLFAMVAGFSIHQRAHCKRNRAGLPVPGGKRKPAAGGEGPSPLRTAIDRKAGSLALRPDLDRTDHGILAAAGRWQGLVMKPLPRGTTPKDEARRAALEVTKLFAKIQIALALRAKHGGATRRQEPRRAVPPSQEAASAGPPCRTDFHLDDDTGEVMFRGKHLHTFDGMRRTLFRVLRDAEKPFAGEKELYSALRARFPEAWPEKSTPNAGETGTSKNRSVAATYQGVSGVLKQKVGTDVLRKKQALYGFLH